MDVVVRSVRSVTPRIKSFELADPAGAPLPAFEAGSHVDVTLPNGLVRSYSLLNDSRERNRYVIAVLREQAGGGGSAWVHDSLKEGDVLTITEPQNRFEIDEGGDHNILIAGGIGITPILSMAERSTSWASTSSSTTARATARRPRSRSTSNGASAGGTCSITIKASPSRVSTSRRWCATASPGRTSTCADRRA